jgi:hypothetical protein
MSQSFDLTPELVARLDKLAPSPGEVAEKIWNSDFPLKEQNQIEVLYFCVEYLALHAQNSFPDILDSVKEIAKYIYFTHYTSVFDAALASRNERKDSNISSTEGTIPEPDNGERGDVSGGGLEGGDIQVDRDKTVEDEAPIIQAN